MKECFINRVLNIHLLEGCKKAFLGKEYKEKRDKLLEQLLKLIMNCLLTVLRRI